MGSEAKKLSRAMQSFSREVRDFSLDGHEPLPADVVQRSRICPTSALFSPLILSRFSGRIKEDMKLHRVLVFKGQGRLSGARQAGPPCAKILRRRCSRSLALRCRSRNSWALLLRSEKRTCARSDLEQLVVLRCKPRLRALSTSIRGA